MTQSFRPVPAPRPLDAIARRGRPRWGLRFLLLLVATGVATYFLRPYISWIDDRISAVEQTASGLARQYGIAEFVSRVGWMMGKDKPAALPAAPVAPPSAPVAVERAVPAAPVVPAVAVRNQAARPDIEPLSPRASRGLGGPAADKLGGRLASAAPIGRRGVREAPAVRLRGGYAYRERATPARRRMAIANPGARRPRRMLDASEIAARELAAEEAAAARAAAAPPPARAAAPAAAVPAAPAEPEVRAPAPPPPAAEEKPATRSTASLVREAASSGDELDRLMAGAVSERSAAPARPQRTDRATAEIDRKLAAVDKGEGASPATRGRATPAAAPLSTSDIKTVMAGVQKRMNECFRQHGQAGPADVKVEVAPDGSVPGTVIRGALAGTPTGACVEAKIKEATFPASSGLRFDYRLSVR